MTTSSVNCCAFTDLTQWKDAKKSGITFGVGMAVLYTLYSTTLLGLISNTLFFATSICCLWVLIKNVINAFQQQQGQAVQAAHPFQFLLDTVPAKLRISEDDALKMAPKIAACLNKLVSDFLRLVLVDSWANSTVLIVVLYFTRGIFASHEMLCLVGYAWIGVFTLPVVYKMKKDEIDGACEKVMTPLRPHIAKVSDMIAKFKSAKAATAEESKEE